MALALRLPMLLEQAFVQDSGGPSEAMICMQACSPHNVFVYFLRNGEEGWASLGGIVLAITDAPLAIALCSIERPQW